MTRAKLGGEALVESFGGPEWLSRVLSAMFGVSQSHTGTWELLWNSKFRERRTEAHSGCLYESRVKQSQL